VNTDARYQVKDWHKFQHFKDRRPPWVKLYRDLIDDPEYIGLDPFACKYLVLLWLIASEDDDKGGALPCCKTLAFRLRLSMPDLERALAALSHWLIRLDITPISPRYQDDAPETETETETEEREKSPPPKVAKAKTFKTWTEEEFRQEMREANDGEVLTTEQLHAFFAHWTEPDATGKPRRALEKTWKTRSRIQKWARNAKNWGQDEAPSPRGYTA